MKLINMKLLQEELDELHTRLMTGMEDASADQKPARVDGAPQEAGGAAGPGAEGAGGGKGQGGGQDAAGHAASRLARGGRLTREDADD